MCAVVKTGIVSTQLLNIPVLIQEIQTFIKWATNKNLHNRFVFAEVYIMSLVSEFHLRLFQGGNSFVLTIPTSVRRLRFRHFHGKPPCHLLSGGGATGFIASYRCSTNFCGPVMWIHSHSPGSGSSSWVFQGP